MASVYSMHDGEGMAAMKGGEKQKYKFKKGDKAPVDENAPKKPLSGYFRFAEAQRKELGDDGSKASETMKIIGAKWKELSAEKKEKYEGPARKQKETYQRLLSAYKLSAGYQEFQKKLHAYKIFETKKAFKKDPNMPKKALSAYMLYINSIRQEITNDNPDLKMTELAPKMSAKWNALSQEEKIPWNDKAKSAKEAQEKKVAQYMKSAQRKEYEAEKEEYLAKMEKKRENLKKKSKKRSLDDKTESTPKAKKAKTEKSSDKKSSKKKSLKKPMAPKSTKKSASKGKKSGSAKKAKNSKKAKAPKQKAK